MAILAISLLNTDRRLKNARRVRERYRAVTMKATGGPGGIAVRPNNR
jgi:hypothetical protein